MRVTKSQVAFRRRVGFAYAWMTAMVLRRGDVPLVLTIGLRRRDPSSRWKEVVEPASGRFTHHLELRTASEVDDEVRGAQGGVGGGGVAGEIREPMSSPPTDRGAAADTSREW